MTTPDREDDAYDSSRVVVIGPTVPSGAYLLHILVRKRCSVTFGAFRRGKPVAVPAGDYLYVGSAMGLKGPTSLAGRLLRHATRSGDRPPHLLRCRLRRRLLEKGLLQPDQAPPAKKRLHWHVDYLLDEAAAALRGAYLVCSNEKLESILSQWLLEDPETFILARGLGASDARAPAHLVGVRPNPHWWLTLPQRLRQAVELRAVLPPDGDAKGTA